MGITVHHLRYRGPFGPSSIDDLAGVDLSSLDDGARRIEAAAYEWHRVMHTTVPLVIETHLSGFPAASGQDAPGDIGRFSECWQPVLLSLRQEHGDDFRAILDEIKVRVRAMAITEFAGTLDGFELVTEEY